MAKKSTTPYKEKMAKIKAQTEAAAEDQSKKEETTPPKKGCKCADKLREEVVKLRDQKDYLVKVNQELMKEKDDLQEYVDQTKDLNIELEEINKGQKIHIDNYKNTLGEMVEERSKLERDASSFKIWQMTFAFFVGVIITIVCALMFFKR